ncbi:MAG: hypothetical protein Q9M17_09515 [Mariprofundus sp.]|nr:hypothetical protein [Mariprofundus sp.]
MLKTLTILAMLAFTSGCAAIYGEDPAELQARQQAEQAQHQKQVSMQAEIERLKAEVKANKIELESIK